MKCRKAIVAAVSFVITTNRLLSGAAFDYPEVFVAPSELYPYHDSWNIFVTGEALFWKASEIGLELAVLDEASSSSETVGSVVQNTANDSGKLKNLDFDYK